MRKTPAPSIRRVAQDPDTSSDEEANGYRRRKTSVSATRPSNSSHSSVRTSSMNSLPQQTSANRVTTTKSLTRQSPLPSTLPSTQRANSVARSSSSSSSTRQPRRQTQEEKDFEAAIANSLKESSSLSSAFRQQVPARSQRQFYRNFADKIGSANMELFDDKCIWVYYDDASNEKLHGWNNCGLRAIGRAEGKEFDESQLTAIREDVRELIENITDRFTAENKDAKQKVVAPVNWKTAMLEASTLAKIALTKFHHIPIFLDGTYKNTENAVGDFLQAKSSELGLPNMNFSDQWEYAAKRLQLLDMCKNVQQNGLVGLNFNDYKKLLFELDEYVAFMKKDKFPQVTGEVALQMLHDRGFKCDDEKVLQEQKARVDAIKNKTPNFNDELRNWKASHEYHSQIFLDPEILQSIQKEKSKSQEQLKYIILINPNKYHWITAGKLVLGTHSRINLLQSDSTILPKIKGEYEALGIKPEEQIYVLNVFREEELPLKLLAVFNERCRLQQKFMQ